jgi:hypothetical protein
MPALPCSSLVSAAAPHWARLSLLGFECWAERGDAQQGLPCLVQPRFVKSSFAMPATLGSVCLTELRAAMPREAEPAALRSPSHARLRSEVFRYEFAMGRSTGHRQAPPALTRMAERCLDMLLSAQHSVASHSLLCLTSHSCADTALLIQALLRYACLARFGYAVLGRDLRRTAMVGVTAPCCACHALSCGAAPWYAGPLKLCTTRRASHAPRRSGSPSHALPSWAKPALQCRARHYSGLHCHAGFTTHRPAEPCLEWVGNEWLS